MSLLQPSPFCAATSACGNVVLAEHSRRLVATGKREIQNSLIDFIMRTELRRIVELRVKAEQRLQHTRLHSGVPNWTGAADGGAA
jgi:hypothetical protein